MSVFKCKMCGGALEINSGETVAICEYCGTKQTLPRLTDDRKANLYDRANHFRRNNEFDKAMGIYEQILNEDTADAESYWSVVLCRYGIEYVEDPVSRKRVPTVNRAQFTSIFDDEDYKSAIKYADGYQKQIYENEATQINEIQKGILAISQNEEPFDVFICYKETDKDGRRTQDSVLATELYHELIEEGYKVFFSRITLEDKLGIAYEPYIFAALHSAKVMVVLGTKPENFNAVWVKNEWSRFLAMIKDGENKILIPAYRDMDPYDLPEEFSHLQAQDMSKLGFMQDLVRGIKKLSLPEEEKEVKETVVMGNANADPLLRRAFMFLEDGDFTRADEFCEKVLNMEPENEKAYLGKLMAEYKVKTQERLIKCKESFENSNNYKKALRFGNDEFKDMLEGYAKARQERELNEKNERIYASGMQKMQTGTKEGTFISAAEDFEKISDYKDSSQLAMECREKAKIARKEELYEKANTLLQSGKNIVCYDQAKNILNSLEDFKDSAEKKILCENKIQECLDIEEKRRIEQERSKKEAEERKRKKIKNQIILVLILIGVIILFLVVKHIVSLCRTEKIYDEAVSLYEQGRYEEAINLFPERKKTEIYKNCYSKYREETLKKYPVVDVSENAYFIVSKDGTVVAEAINENGKSQCKVDDWTDIIDVSVSPHHSVGLKSDGTVVAVGSNADGKCEVGGWTDIVDVQVSSGHTVGLKSNGTVVATGENRYGECDVSEWTDIVAIATGTDHTVGLKSNGTVVATGSNRDGRCNTEKMEDIIEVCASSFNTIGLKSDGTVAITGSNMYDKSSIRNWEKIVTISAGINHIVGLKTDGTVASVGDNFYGQCDVSEWTDVNMILTTNTGTMGIKDDWEKAVGTGKISCEGITVLDKEVEEKSLVTTSTQLSEKVTEESPIELFESISGKEGFNDIIDKFGEPSTNLTHYGLDENRTANYNIAYFNDMMLNGNKGNICIHFTGGNEGKDKLKSICWNISKRATENEYNEIKEYISAFLGTPVEKNDSDKDKLATWGKYSLEYISGDSSPISFTKTFN